MPGEIDTSRVDIGLMQCLAYSHTLLIMADFDIDDGQFDSLDSGIL